MKRPTSIAISLVILLALAGCTTEGTGDINDPKTDYIHWYETADHNAKVQCYTTGGGADCDWDHIILKDQQ